MAFVKPKRQQKAPSKPDKEAMHSDVGDDSRKEEVHTTHRTCHKVY
jgi:hypothetical protein